MEEKTYIFEGKTTNEAIENGLKELNLPKNKVEIKVLDQEDKRSFFSILTPRVVKVEIKVKEGIKDNKKEISKEDILKSRQAVEKFLKEFLGNLNNKDLNYEISEKDNNIIIEINGKDSGFLIGYRGEVLNSLQIIISNIANKGVDGKIKVLLNIGGYRQKREKDLQILATKIASSVIRNNKKIVLEPMSAYERKIIHTKLQENDKVKTYSIGEEPYRKVVVDLK
ncbi:MAG: RNA-binding cell elongation regulator Jag/EloR [Candidatus Scatovivens sp.]